MKRCLQDWRGWQIPIQQIIYNGSWRVLSPSSSNNVGSYAFYVSNTGLRTSYVDDTNAVRPVINLRADVTVASGDGTESNPYVIET